MTYEEAKEYIMQNWFDGNENIDSVVDGDDETFSMITAIEALERRIPKKPLNITYDDGYIESWNCPNCGMQHTTFIDDYIVFEGCCDSCGQAIDWSEE